MSKKDNSTLDYKIMLRRELFDILPIDDHYILETHGGAGILYQRCYSHIDNGVVFEIDGSKSNILAKQRQTWRVYQADCIPAIRSGVARDMSFTLLDVDPYGSPWDTISAFFESNRSFAPIMGVAVNDGLRQKVRIGAWDVKLLQDIVRKHGNKIHGIFLNSCRELLEGFSDVAGYNVNHFSGYYTGHNQQMTHYMAILKQR